MVGSTPDREGNERGRLIDALWSICEQLIAAYGIVIDRPKGSAHPRFPETIYPVAYGYLPGTDGGDGGGIDVFVGEGGSGLIGYAMTVDRLKEDREIKLLWNLTPDDVAAVERFLNSGEMTATFVWRRNSHGG